MNKLSASLTALLVTGLLVAGPLAGTAAFADDLPPVESTVTVDDAPVADPPAAEPAPVVESPSADVPPTDPPATDPPADDAPVAGILSIIPDIIRPATPTGFAVAVQPGHATFSWDFVVVAHTLRIAGDDGSVEDYDLFPFAATHTSYAVNPGVHYTAYLSAYVAGAFSSYAAVDFNGPALPDDGPSHPTGLVASLSQHDHLTQIIANWDAPSVVIADLDHYTVKVWGDNGYVAYSTVGADTQQLVLTVPNDAGVTYTVKVAAGTLAGNGPYSIDVNAGIAVAQQTDAAVDLTATIDLVSNTTSLTWNAPDYTGGSPITGWTITVFDEDYSWLDDEQLAANARSFSFGDTPDDGEHFRFVLALATAGSSAEAAVTVANGEPHTAPTAVQQLAASPTGFFDAGLTVTWAAPASNGGDDIWGYTVIITDSDGTSSGWDVGPNAFRFAFTDLLPSSSYSVTVFAKNTRGNGPAMVPVTVTTNTPTPLAPAPVTVVGDVRSSVDGDTITAVIPGTIEGDWVFGYAFSTPTSLGWAQVRAGGVASWSLAGASLPTGIHTLVVLDANGNVINSGRFAVAGATPTATLRTASVDGSAAGVSALAFTGVETGAPLIWAAILLTLGMALTIARTRRAAEER